MTNLQKALLIAAIILWIPMALITVAIVNHDYVDYLPMGYQILAGNAGGEWSESIFRNPGLYNFYRDDDLEQKRVGYIDGYRVYPRIITGHAVPNNSDNSNYKFNEPKGYFIIDLKTNKIQRGLTKKAWLEKLEGYGITHEPVLFESSPNDELLGRTKPQPPYN
ncbi:MAG: hypothetical protein ACYC27_20975 [Armatimonadota bacterium]